MPDQYTRTRAQLGTPALDVLRRAHVGCVFCDGNKDISAFRGKNICPKCIKALQECGQF